MPSTHRAAAAVHARGACRLGLALVALLCLGAGAARGAQADDAAPAWSSDQRLLYFGIPVQVRFTPADAALADRAWRYLVGIDAIFNDYHDDSEIGRINHGGPGAYQLSPDLAEAFAAAVELGRLTGGTFDITVGPLRRLYRKAETDGHFPSAAEIAAARSRVGPQTFRLEGDRLTVLAAGVAFDFGGLIKGMAVDHVMAMLTAAKVTAALVQCGGETGCFGLSPHGRPHRLGVPDPRNEQAMWCTLQDPGSGLAGSTSGNYRNAIIIDAQEYYHVFDPRSGLPAATRVLSASVAFPAIGRNGEADGLAKLGILEPERFLETVRARGGQAMVLVRTADGGVEERHSAGWPALCVAPAAAGGAAP